MISIYSKSRVSMGMYRKCLMQFIRFTEQRESPFDILLYSLAATHSVIFHAVIIETYYNFVFAPKHSFHFKYVIGSCIDDCSPNYKSLLKLMRYPVLGRDLMTKYKGIVIVDDLHRNAWNQMVPTEMVNAQIRVLCLAPKPFSRHWDWYRVNAQKINMTDSVYRLFESGRDSDETFKRIMQILRAFQTGHIGKVCHSLQWLEINKFQ